MEKANDESHALIDRHIWKTSRELAEEFDYDYANISRLAKTYKISSIRNPVGSPFGGQKGLLFNRAEFSKIPTIVDKLISNEDLEVYNEELHLNGNWMLTGDWHIPFHFPDLVKKTINIADRFGIHNLLICGDFADLEAFSKFTGAKKSDWKSERARIRNVIKCLLGHFKKIVWTMGNHDLRFWKKLEGLGEEDDIFQLITSGEISGQVQYSIYPYTILNESWFLTHPKSYSRIQARNAFFLASKYVIPLIKKGQSPNGIYGIVSYHGHQGGEGTDVSAAIQVADGMCICDPERIKYRQMNITTHPEWRPGFMMLHNNYLYRFPRDETDWKFWLNGI